jgi:hypothetical protein
MDRALKEADLPLQICMGLPNDALFSVELEAVTTFRASQDDSAKYAPQVMELDRVLKLYMLIMMRVFETAIQSCHATSSQDRWDIGESSLLLGALGLRPYFDVTWTASHIPQSDNNYGPTTTWYNSTELEVSVPVVLAKTQLRIIHSRFVFRSPRPFFRLAQSVSGTASTTRTRHSSPQRACATGRC